MKNTVVTLTCVWFVILSALAIDRPDLVGRWQAQMEYAFLMEAERIGMWSE